VKNKIETKKLKIKGRKERGKEKKE